jgi:hypothetical protein
VRDKFGAVDSVDPVSVRGNRKFLWIALSIIVMGLATTSALALVVDPLHIFGTGRIESILTGERDEKPIAFLNRKPAPQAVILGSSRVMKVRPSCLTDLTGLPAYNFGLSNSAIEDMVAVMGFVRGEAHAPVQLLVIGLDVEQFDDGIPIDPRLLSADHLRPYVVGANRRTWSTVTQALFGWQGFRYAAISLRFHFFPNAKPKPKSHDEADGLVRYDVWDEEISKGTFNPRNNLASTLPRFSTSIAARGFGQLSASRLAMFRSFVAQEHSRGTEIHVVIPPIHRDLSAARRGPIDQRTAELDASLRAMAREGLFEYFSISSPSSFNGDPDGYYDGMHLNEQNTDRMLLAVFHRQHGCGI